MAAGSMEVARPDARAVVLGDGRVLVLGNHSTYRQEYDPTIAELWDLVTNAWRTTEPLAKARGEYVALPLRDGRALVTGGINTDGESYSSTHLFDPTTERWEKSGLMGTARTGAAGAVLHDGRVLVMGGGFYTGFEGVGLAPGVVLVGFKESPTPPPQRPEIELANVEPSRVGYALATAELFDPTTGAWSPTDSLRYARLGASAATLGDGRVLVWGSQGGDSLDEQAPHTGEIYDPATGSFSLVDPLPDVDRSTLEKMGIPLPDRSPQGGGWGSVMPLADGDALLIVTDWAWYPLDLTRMFRFDTATSNWTELGEPYVSAEVPEGAPAQEWGVRHPEGFVAPLADGTILFAGGYGVDRERDAMLLDPTTGAWSTLGPMPTGRNWSTGVSLSDGSLLIVGGRRMPGDPDVDGDPAIADALRFVPGG
jgi:hypothetical protein